MGRHELREQVFLLLFCVEFHDLTEMTGQIKLFFENSEDISFDKDADYIQAKCQAVLGRLSEIDGLINRNTEGWDTSRMGKVELAVLRLAVYEMCFDGG